MSTAARSQAASGLALFASALVALLWANLSPATYRAVFDFALTGFTVRDVISEVLMALFFFVVGMELKDELRSRALLPAAAALGGMVVPALIFLAFNRGGPGWGIPMATDIAFCVGVCALLGDRVPRALVVFITALAVFDDLGGILVIALFYGHQPHLGWLLAALAVIGALVAFARAQVSSGALYALAGASLWFAMYKAGIHPTLSGVAVGFAIPQPQTHVPRWRPWAAWGVMPLFALASAGVPLSGFNLMSPIALGVGLGLAIGKPLGIFSVTALAVKLRLAALPEGASWRGVLGASVLAGIGFTVALFIAALAYPDPAQLETAKAGVLAGSLVAGVLGALVLRVARA